MYVVKEKPPEDMLAIYPVKSDFQGIGRFYISPCHSLSNWLIALGTMIDKSSSRMPLTQLKAGLNKWRIAFLVFALSYAVLLVLNLSNVPMQWDEVVLYVNNADHAKNLMIKIAFF